jgi:NAD(P)-dependent dehydrogenase (short-subunit alcohol dehydrogenase family)
MSRVAIITGAGSGIGRATAIQLMNDGFTVVLAGRRQEALEETANAAPAGASMLVVPTDMSDEKAVMALFAETKATFGCLDLLFNNAGTTAPDVLLEDLTLEDWKTVVNVNLTGVFLCTREAFRIMKDQEPQGGRIINNGSISAHVPRPNSAAYTATKHAVTGLTRATSLDGRKYDIACGQIDIGNAATGMVAVTEVAALQPNGSTMPEPTMDVEHVARAVAYMACLPLEANVQFMTIKATKMPYVGRG